MSELFVDLYRYRERENQNPLEDWLTECLAATLRTLSVSMQAAVLAELTTISNHEIEAAISKHGLSIETQYVAGAYGRPDMLLSLGDAPWILFENKVGHHLGHTEVDEGPRNQLERYAHWLTNQNTKPPLPHAMVFVTHLTSAPSDFIGPEGSGPYLGLKVHSTSWGLVGRTLTRLTSDLDEDQTARTLTNAFATYLENEDMSSEFPNSTDLAATELFLAHGESVETLIDKMWNEARTVADSGKNGSYKIESLHDYGRISASRYVQSGPQSPRGSAWVETGVWFPGLNEWFDEEELPGTKLSGPQVFLFFAHDDDDVFTATPGAPAGFHRPGSDFFICRPMSDFSDEPDERGRQVIAWVAEQAAALRPFLTEASLIL